MGYQAVMCGNPGEVMSQLRIQGCQLLIIDCLLPKMSGVDLAKKIKAEVSPPIPIILTSGIYKDKAFVKDSLQQTGALAFLPKPFNIGDLQALVHKALEKLVDQDLSPVETLLTSVLSPQEKIQTVNELESIESYDIPWVVSLLMNASATGVLRLDTDKDKSAISFSKGKIFQVDMANPESFFGALLIEKGYLSPEQLDHALKMKSPKKLGERLVDLNMLSPHVIDIINSEQTAIRLSRVITDSTYTISFKEEAVGVGSVDGALIDTEEIAPFLVDWTYSKIGTDWLKQRYLKWLDSPPVKNPQAPRYQRLWSLPPLSESTDLVRSFESGMPLSHVLAQGAHPEDQIYQVFHLLILTGYLYIKREIKAADESAQITRLERIVKDMATQDYFAILGLGRNAKAPDIKRTYHELAKLFHPDKVASNSSAKLKELTQKVFSHMTTAYETLADETKRGNYLKEIDMGRAEKILKAETLLEEGKALLKAGQAAKAKFKFEAAVQLRPPNSELLIHLAWAKMMGAEVKGGETALLEVESALNKIPPEDRHNSTYYFVKGLFQKMLGEDSAAKKNMQHALALNPKFIEAERALRTFDSKKKVNTDIFRGDLKDVVGNLFRKK